MMQAEVKKEKTFFSSCGAFFRKVWAWIKEFLRKQVVGLKRQPSKIVLIFIGLCLVVYTFNMTAISNTTERVNGERMGLMAFITTLLSILIVVAAMNAYPKRKPTRISMLVITFAMIAIMILCDIGYYLAIEKALNRPVEPLQITEATMYILKAQSILITHIVFLAITSVIIICLPLIKRLLMKINTNIIIEEQKLNVEELELAEDDE